MTLTANYPQKIYSTDDLEPIAYALYEGQKKEIEAQANSLIDWHCWEHQGDGIYTLSWDGYPDGLHYWMIELARLSGDQLVDHKVSKFPISDQNNPQRLTECLAEYSKLSTLDAT